MDLDEIVDQIKRSEPVMRKGGSITFLDDVVVDAMDVVVDALRGLSTNDIKFAAALLVIDVAREGGLPILGDLIKEDG